MYKQYIDQSYEGGTIGEYQFYNISTKEWNKSTCRTGRCARMDCHEPNTHFKLLGVFKENDGLYDFAEQLFNHQGYCVWNNTAYEFMSEYRESWPSTCKSVYFYDDDGKYNKAYLNMHPQAFGYFTYGLYEDNTCTTLSSKYDASTYFRYYYGQNGYNDEELEEKVAGFEYNQQLMNEYMNEYKICQPCRAYSKYENYANDDDDGSGSNDNEDHSDEGGGYAEQWGFNCYDDAGYKNCNQCYKFQTKTDMEAADTYDLATASKQGSILEIKVNGKTYGSGGYRPESPSSYDSTKVYFLYCSIFITSAIAVLIWKKKSSMISDIFVDSFKDFKEEFITSDSSTDTDDSDSQESIEKGNIIDQSPAENWIILRSRVERDDNAVSRTKDYIIRAATSNNDRTPKKLTRTPDKLKCKATITSKEENIKTEKESKYLAPTETARNNNVTEDHDCNQRVNESVYLVPMSYIEDEAIENNNDGKEHKGVATNLKKEDEMAKINNVELCEENYVLRPITADEAIRNLQDHFDRVSSELDEEVCTTLESK